MRLPLPSSRLVAGFAGILLAPGVGNGLAAEPPIHMLVPGFSVQELPVRLSNVNNLRFAPDGRLTALGYDGRIHLLRDTDGDGLEDRADPFWTAPTLSVPVGMAWSTRGLLVSSKGKVSLLRDTDGDGAADEEEIIAQGWPPTDVGSGGVDATAVTLDAEGNVYFGLLVADYSNAYRLRQRKNLTPEDKAWLVARGRAVEGDPEETVSLYDPASPRGTIQKWNATTRSLETVATGIRVPYTLAFNSAGDLFLTDQEGETWLPGGNPLDELNHIVPGRNYGFPPRHPRWLPDLVSEPPVVGFGPQHQSACGLVFNEPHGALNLPANHASADPRARPVSPGQGLFGPKAWTGDAIVAGESRARLWRVRLVKTPSGYVGAEFTFARVGLLTTDVAISPRGDLYVSCHSGPPDWGTGPQGEGRLFRISYVDPAAPQPLLAWRHSSTELRVAFDRPLDPAVAAHARAHRIELGAAVSAGDRFETLKPPYDVVKRQDTLPRHRLGISAARLLDAGSVVALATESPLAEDLAGAVTLVEVRAAGSTGPGATVDVDFGPAGSSAFRWEAGRLAVSDVRRPRWPPLPAASPSAPPDPGDWQRGRALFFGETLRCSQCHRVRGEGGRAGPDLSNLVARDRVTVLRDIREPGASLHPDYIGYMVTTADGNELTGFILAQNPDSIRLLGLDGRETAVPRGTVKALRPSAVSLMPGGLLDSLEPEQVDDLLAFLTRPPPAASAAAPPPKPAQPSPPRRRRAEVEATLAASGPAPAAAVLRPRTIVLVASRQDHGPGEHDYPWWQTNWAALLGQAPRLTVLSAWQWPAPEHFERAEALMLYCWNHDWNAARYAELDRFLDRGGGLVILHSACIADREPEPLAERLGFSAQPGRTGYRHGALELRLTTRHHPITRGLPAALPFVDETYWPLIVAGRQVEVLATAEEEGQPRPMLWTSVRGRGRVFGSILGHYSRTYDDPFFRLLILRGLAWSLRESESRFEHLATQGASLAD
ncbi:MAG TPA: ThuA domain-containing protein [Methylomirabilota bacterium]|nr:ThuA domain-containing protein [Methylomirabilota bacterium]